MGKTVKAQVAPGTDWWGRRPVSRIAVSRHGMKWWKRYLHKIERQAIKRHMERD
jgi:hypothetical protein